MEESTAQDDVGGPEPRRAERVCLETAMHSVTGNVSLPLQGYRARFSDYLNRSDIDYLALTDVERQPLEGGEVSRFPFLAVARTSILFGYPVG